MPDDLICTRYGQTMARYTVKARRVTRSHDVIVTLFLAERVLGDDVRCRSSSFGGAMTREQMEAEASRMVARWDSEVPA